MRAPEKIGVWWACLCFLAPGFGCPVSPPSKEITLELSVRDGGGNERTIVERHLESASEAERLAELPPEPPPKDQPKSPYPSLTKPLELEPAKAIAKIRIQPSLSYDGTQTLGLAFTGPGEGSNLAIFFARLDKDGKEMGTPLRVDTSKGGNKSEPVVCGLAGGGFVIAWPLDTKQPDPKLGNLQIRFRRIDANGQFLDKEDVQVRTKKDGNHWLARIACTSEGGFVIAGVYPDSEKTFGVFFFRFGADGKPLGEPTHANTTTDGNQTFPAIGVSKDGTVAISWQQERKDGTGANVQEVIFRVFPATGQPSPEIVATSVGSVSSRASALVVDRESGRIVIAASQASLPLLLRSFEKDGSGSKTLVFPENGFERFVNPAMSSLDKPGEIALVYLKGSGTSYALRVALFGPPEFPPQPVSLAVGKLPPYHPSVAYRKGQLAVAWTERAANSSFTIKLNLFQ